jgi:hypothetical protein
MTPPAWPFVPAKVQKWIDDVCLTGENIRSGRDLDRPLVEELARLHNEFERIHPFLDGNGRAGRLVLNLVLVRLGYPPVIIFKRQRDAYLTAMQRADLSDYGALRTDRQSDVRQPQPVHRAQRGRTGTACSAYRSRGRRVLASRVAPGRPAGQARRGARPGRRLAQLA